MPHRLENTGNVFVTSPFLTTSGSASRPEVKVSTLKLGLSWLFVCTVKEWGRRVAAELPVLLF